MVIFMSQSVEIPFTETAIAVDKHTCFSFCTNKCLMKFLGRIFFPFKSLLSLGYCETVMEYEHIQ